MPGDWMSFYGIINVINDILSYGEYFFAIFRRKNAAKRDNAGAVCNSGMGMLFALFF